MRIEAYTQVQQIYKTTKADKSQKKAGTGFAGDQQTAGCLRGLFRNPESDCRHVGAARHQNLTAHKPF